VVKQIPKPGFFVFYVEPKHKTEVARRLGSTGAIEELDEGMLLLQVSTKASRPEAQWAEVVELVGPLAMVQPVLSDEKGNTQLPTGDLTVRFRKKRSDKQLQEFAARYRLRLRERNEFVPEQAAFKIDESSTTYLPDVLQQVAADKDVKDAWASTRSRYKRMT
jgi:hypothetical protein